jgi:hypothetical protein
MKERCVATLRRRSFAALLAATLPSCATLFAPGPDKVRFTSEPAGASVTIDGQLVGSTPLDVEVPRKAIFVSFAKDGFRDATFQIPRSINGWIFMNILGGLVPIMVDFATHNDETADGEVHAQLQVR